MSNKTEKELLNEFIEIQKWNCRGGSGDDEFYVQQIEKYIKEQNLLWMDFIKFIKKERNAEVKQVIEEWSENSEELLQKLGLEK